MTRKSKRQISKNKKRFSKKRGGTGENPIGAEPTLTELARKSARNLAKLPLKTIDNASEITGNLLDNVQGIAGKTGKTAEAVVENALNTAESGTNIVKNIVGVGDDALKSARDAVNMARVPFTILGNRARRSELRQNAETTRENMNQENKTESEKQMQDDNIRLLNAESLLNINRRRSDIYRSQESINKQDRKTSIDELNDTTENEKEKAEINVKHKKVMDDIKNIEQQNEIYAKKAEIKNQIDAKKAEIFRDLALVELKQEGESEGEGKKKSYNALKSLNFLQDLVNNNLNADCISKRSGFLSMKKSEKCSSDLDKRAYNALKHLKENHKNISWDLLVLKASIAAHELYNKENISSTGGRKTKRRNRKKKRKTKRRNKRKYSRRN